MTSYKRHNTRDRRQVPYIYNSIKVMGKSFLKNAAQFSNF